MYTRTRCHTQAALATLKVLFQAFDGQAAVRAEAATEALAVAEEGTAALAETVVAAEAVVGAEVGGSDSDCDSDRCSAVRAEAANTLMNLSSCCQPCIEFSPRFFHYIKMFLFLLLFFFTSRSLLLQLLLLCVSVSVSFCICCASAHCAAQILCCLGCLPLFLPHPHLSSLPRPVSLALAFFCL